MKFRQTLLPLITAMIWGAAFTAQSICADHLGAFSINGLRFLIAFLVLFPICLIRRKTGGAGRNEILMGCGLCGFALFLATNAQQMALNAGASAGKAGFVTALYIVLVPLGQMILYRKKDLRVWIAVLIAMAGMYFLCLTEEFTVETSDLYLVLCAVLFTGQILLVDRFSKKIDGFVLSSGEFLVTAVCSLLVAFRTEVITAEAVRGCLGALLYVSILSSCVGYTFQIMAQKDGDPALISLIFSLESFFAALFGAILLNERLTGREILGCALMAAAILVAEWPRGQAAGKEPQEEPECG